MTDKRKILMKENEILPNILVSFLKFRNREPCEIALWIWMGVGVGVRTLKKVAF